MNLLSLLSHPEALLDNLPELLQQDPRNLKEPSESIPDPPNPPEQPQMLQVKHLLEQGQKHLEPFYLPKLLE